MEEYVTIKSPAKGKFTYELHLRDGRKFTSRVFDSLQACEKAATAARRKYRALDWHTK